MQLGFQRNLRTEKAIAIAEYSRSSEDCIAALDLKGAYDSVDGHKLLDICADRLPPHLSAMIASTMGTLVVKTVGDATSCTGETRLVVVQGAPLNLVLYNIYIDDLAYSLCEDLGRTSQRLPDIFYACCMLKPPPHYDLRYVCEMIELPTTA